jgi:hypothetical protein
VRVCWRAVSSDAVIVVGHRGDEQSILGLAVRRRRHAGQAGDRRSVCGVAVRLRSGLGEGLRRGSRGCGGLIFENEVPLWCARSPFGLGAHWCRRGVVVTCMGQALAAQRQESQDGTVCDALLERKQPVNEKQCIAYPVAAGGALSVLLPMDWHADCCGPCSAAPSSNTRCLRKVVAEPRFAASRRTWTRCYPGSLAHCKIDSVRGAIQSSRLDHRCAGHTLGLLRLGAGHQPNIRALIPSPIPSAPTLSQHSVALPLLCPPQPPSENVAVTDAGPQVELVLALALAVTTRRSLPASPPSAPVSGTSSAATQERRTISRALHASPAHAAPPTNVPTHGPTPLLFHS